jgi:hypothetical protein
MSGIASASDSISTTGLSINPNSVAAAAVEKKYVTGVTRKFAKDATIPATTLHEFYDSRGKWAGVLTRYDITESGDFYIAYYQGYVYLEN